MTYPTLKLLLLASAASLLAATPALADTLNLDLSNPSPTVAAGSTYEFDGTISAPVSNDFTEYLSDSENVDVPLVLDDTDFLLDAPFSLDPGASYTGALFTIFVPTGTTSGTYTGYFDVIGNDDPTIVGSERFTINVGNAAAVTPEPGSWLLLATGLGTIGLLRRRFARA